MAEDESSDLSSVELHHEIVEVAPPQGGFAHRATVRFLIESDTFGSLRLEVEVPTNDARGDALDYARELLFRFAADLADKANTAAIRQPLRSYYPDRS